jgi:hypothetical protein
VCKKQERKKERKKKKKKKVEEEKEQCSGWLKQFVRSFYIDILLNPTIQLVTYEDYIEHRENAYSSSS